MATEKAVIGQAQRVLVDATNKIWHKISTWTHASDVEMPDGEPLNEYLTDLNDSINDRFDGKYNSYNFGTTAIGSLDAIPEIGYSRIQTIQNITAGDYTIPINHTCYCYSGQDPASIEKMAVMIDTTDLTSIVMYIAHYSREARWTLTKIATQKQIDNLQMQIDELNSAFNQLNLFVQQSVGDLNARYQIIQDQMDWLEAELAELQEFLNDLLNELRDFKAETRGRLDRIDRIFRGLYGEVGSLYLTTSSVINGRLAYEFLEEYFGGKWVLVQDAYLYAGHFAIRDDEHAGDNDLVFKPTEDNFSRMQNWQVTFSDMTQSEVSDNKDRLSRDYSQIYQGRNGFSLEVSNLPEHYHQIYGNPSTWIPTYQLSDDYISPFVDISVDPHQIQTDDGSEYVGTFFRRKHMKKYGSYGYNIGVNHVENQDHDDSFVSAPIELNPTRFKIYVWAKVAM